MPFRPVLAGLLAATLVTGAGMTRTRPGADRTQTWVATVVTRIGEGTLAAASRGTGPAPVGGTVTVRLRIAADGRLEAAAVEEGSGSEALDARALEAARAASPFPPPPETILTLEGFTELSFPVQVGAPRRR